MSELIDTPNNRNTFRRQLLATVSAVALLGSICVADKARADDADRPVVWIELGGQAEKLSDNQEPFIPAFRNLITQNGFPSPLGSEIGSGWMVGGEGKISFQPEDSDWVFSAAMRFGRANGHKDNRLQKTVQLTGVGISSIPALWDCPSTNKFLLPAGTHARIMPIPRRPIMNPTPFSISRLEKMWE